MNWSTGPPAVAGGVAIAIAVTRRLAPILLESSMNVPSPRSLSLVIMSGRIVSFALVYGLLLGFAFAVGRRRDGTTGDGTVVLATGTVAALAHVVAAGVILLALEPQQGPIVSALMTVGSGVGVGVHLAVVTFAGLALADRQRASGAASA